MRMILRGTVCCVLAVSMCGCSRVQNQSSESPLQRYGLTEARLYRAMVARAVQLANSILQDDVGVKLACSWEQSPEDGAVPVFLVREYNLADKDMVFVPERERF